MTNIVPVADLGRRMVEHGRIRLGVKAGKAMKSIDTFRFTSPDRVAIEQLAAQFGGECVPWSDPKASPINQYEVITQASEIPVWILPGGLSVNYEMWSGGGCVRRCDGIECETSMRSYDADYEAVMVPCLCSADGKLACRPYTRLSVVIPSIRFGGSWRMESKGWNAAEELPGMVDMISQLQATGTLQGMLRLERRQSQGGRRKFVVPTLIVNRSVEEIMGGMTVSSDALTVSSEPIVELSSPTISLDNAIDEIIDVEIIDDVPSVWSLPNAPREPVELTERQLEGLLSGEAKWSSSDEGKVVKA